jgi:hypothetical protein
MDTISFAEESQNWNLIADIKFKLNKRFPKNINVTYSNAVEWKLSNIKKTKGTYLERIFSQQYDPFKVVDKINHTTTYIYNKPSDDISFK